MVFRYAAFGVDLASMVNFETIIDDPPHLLPDGGLPFIGPQADRAASGLLRRDGFVTGRLQWSVLSRTDFNTLQFFLFDDSTLDIPFQHAGRTGVYLSELDEMGFYSPWLVSIDRPYYGDQYRNPINEFLIDIVVPLVDLQIQYTSVSSGSTITASDRLLLGNSSGGGFTTTLPLANAVTVNTVYSFWKVNAENIWQVQRNGTDTIDGGTSFNQTAKNSRTDLISDGVSAWTTIKTNA